MVQRGSNFTLAHHVIAALANSGIDTEGATRVYISQHYINISTSQCLSTLLISNLGTTKILALVDSKKVLKMSASASAIKAQDDKFSSLGLSKTIVNAEQVVTYSRGLGGVSEKNPVLVLIHGYPQSSYM